MNLLFSEEATNFKARSIALVQKVELYWVVYRKHFHKEDLKHSHVQDWKDKPSIWLHTAYQV